MRQFLIYLSIILSAVSASAFQDPITLRASEELIEQMAQEMSPGRRLRQLEEFKDFLYNRLNTIELPDIATTPDEDPRLEEYRSLTEYDGYVNLIRMRDITAKNCMSTKVRIEKSTSRDGVLVPEASAALKILLALCH